MELIVVVAIATLVPAAVQPSSPTVFDLTPDKCAGAEVLIADLSGAQITARCDQNPAATTLRIAVRSIASSTQGLLLGFSLGFCGNPVISADAPPGWATSVDSGERKSTVGWHVRAGERSTGVGSGTRVEGFTLRLKPGWRRSQSWTVSWQSSGAGSSVGHDCL